MTTNELIIDDFYTELLNVYVRCVNDDWKIPMGKINNLRYINRDIIFFISLKLHITVSHFLIMYKVNDHLLWMHAFAYLMAQVVKIP